MNIPAPFATAPTQSTYANIPEQEMTQGWGTIQLPDNTVLQEQYAPQPKWNAQDWAANTQRMDAFDAAVRNRVQEDEDRAMMQQMLEQSQKADDQIKAIAAARKFIGTRKLAKLVEGGMPLEKALAMAPEAWIGDASYAGHVMQMQADFAANANAPKLGEIMPFTDPTTGKPRGNLVRTGKGQLQWIPPEVNMSDVRPAQRITAIRAILSSIDDEIANSRVITPKSSEDDRKRMQSLINQRNQLREELQSLGVKTTTVPQETGGVPVPEPAPAAVATAPAPAQAVAPSGARRVSVVSPSGKRGTIPESQLDAALKQGYRRAD